MDQACIWTNRWSEDPNRESASFFQCRPSTVVMFVDVHVRWVKIYFCPYSILQQCPLVTYSNLYQRMCMFLPTVYITGINTLCQHNFEHNRNLRIMREKNGEPKSSQPSCLPWASYYSIWFLTCHQLSNHWFPRLLLSFLTSFDEKVPNYWPTSCLQRRFKC